MPWVVTGACFVTEHRIVIHVKISYGLLLNKMKKILVFYAFCSFTSLLLVLSNKPHKLGFVYTHKKEEFRLLLEHLVTNRIITPVRRKISNLHIFHFDPLNPMVTVVGIDFIFIVVIGFRMLIKFQSLIYIVFYMLYCNRYQSQYYCWILFRYILTSPMLNAYISSI